ncbi:unnamed protein product [Prorocentrum cordatum]|uniref:Uncharacterized protein n=1 Tax=Prorocentrum cordatum TaxID=2364126 RepID=A0ABN9PX51_9DINO|nr:unnamed protein product [Polarella glacialis]
MLYSRANNRKYSIGEFTTPSLEELRREATLRLQDAGAVDKAKLKGTTGVRNVIGDVAEFHRRKENRYAVFQVASQLNCLEFVHSDVTPEEGITGYVQDRTQGPCCAIACGAGTLYRNYFAPITSAKGNVIRTGQVAARQIECLRDLAAALGNKRHGYLRVKNGYTLATDDGRRRTNHEGDGEDDGSVASEGLWGTSGGSRRHGWTRLKAAVRMEPGREVPFGAGCPVPFSGEPGGR